LFSNFESILDDRNWKITSTNLLYQIFFHGFAWSKTAHTQSQQTPATIHTRLHSIPPRLVHQLRKNLIAQAWNSNTLKPSNAEE
jgi:hypothetical protein